MKTFCVLLALGTLLTACSVTKGKVPHNPARVKTTDQGAFFKFATEYGALVPDSFSAFLWPVMNPVNKNQKLSAKELGEKVFKVAELAWQIDESLKKQARLQVGLKMSYLKVTTKSGSGGLRCSDVGDVEYDGVDLDFEAKETQNSVELEKIEECESMVDQFYLTKENLDEAVAEFLKLKEKNVPKIDKTIGERNLIPVALENTEIRLVPGASGVKVYVVLSGFGPGALTYSTEPHQGQGLILAADYDLKTQVLKFNLLEQRDGRLTGGVFKFSLQRDDFLGFIGFTRFSGDLRYEMAGRKPRYGSCKTFGKFLGLGEIGVVSGER